ncbi:unnamed protein product [Pieris brassicae]|uniref:BPTI/Kunitz inhibitor domain-containing protein n=1 Tax=Pieris brassicae TaxID=7116 RepID=A0A9P0TD27_PIEBR|nr:unnamed protein product [Pieris brassicae]
MGLGYLVLTSAKDRFYYNRQLEKCLPFVYSGCNANENNFETKLDCELRCTDIISTSIKTRVLSLCMEAVRVTQIDSKQNSIVWQHVNENYFEN